MVGDKNPAKRPEVRKKISESNKGKKKHYKNVYVPPMLGKHHTDKAKAKIGKAIKGKTLEKRYGESKAIIVKKNMSVAARESWEVQEIRENRIFNILKASSRRPTSYEEKLININDVYGFPFIYTGDGKKIVAGKSPDFIESNGKKLLIETYSTFWHEKNYEEERYNIFLKYGYKTLFLDDTDLTSLLWMLIVTEKVANFLM